VGQALLLASGWGGVVEKHQEQTPYASTKGNGLGFRGNNADPAYM
jgi:hypothetical protein